jgi:hypothetical protein
MGCKRSGKRMEFIVSDGPPYDLQGSRGAEPDHENLSELPDGPTAWRTPAKSRAATAATVHRRIFPKGGKIARIDLQAAESTAESGNLSNLSAVFTHAHCKRGREDGCTFIAFSMAIATRRQRSRQGSAIASVLYFQWVNLSKRRTTDSDDRLGWIGTSRATKAKPNRSATICLICRAVEQHVACCASAPDCR